MLSKIQEEMTPNMKIWAKTRKVQVYVTIVGSHLLLVSAQVVGIAALSV